MVGSEAKEMLLVLLKCQSHKELTEKTLLCNKFWSRGSFHSSIKEALAEQSKSQQEKLWSALGDSFSKHMQFYLNPESLDDEQADVAGLTNSPSDVRCQATPGSSVTPAADQSSKDDHAKSKAFLLLTLRLMLTYVQSFPSSKEDESLKVTAAVPMSFIKIVLVVGGVLEVVQDQMCSIAVLLCEEWMLRDLPHSLTFAPQLFTVLVRLSIEKKAEKSYVKRVYRLRDVLPTCLEDQGEAATERPTRSTSTEDLVTALAACTVSPVYLACDSGVKFIGLVLAHKSCVLQLLCCVQEVHGCVSPLREGVPATLQQNASQQTGAGLLQGVEGRRRPPQKGNVLVRLSVRRGSVVVVVVVLEDCDLHIEAELSFEEDCLQDLMYGYVTVHPVNSAQLSSNLVAFLHPLHTHQKLPAFSTVLQRLYYPFLWRSLTCANALMRSNATNALCSAYPLEDLARPMEERDLHLTRCHTALTEALTDDHPSVRIVAVQGVCRIMHSYWATLPKNVIQSWFGLLLTRLAYDASSAQVRQQVIKGLYRVLECQDALPFLQQCLPQLGPCFDDCNAAVRLALVRMLLKLQKLRLIKYWNIVSVSHLLHRLTVDTTSVAKLITQLVAPVFLPIQKDNEDLLERSISLLMENRAASRVFYEHVSLGLDVASVVRVMLVLYQALRRHLLLRHQRLNASGSKQPSGKRLRCSSTNNKENTNEDSNSIEGETQAPRESNVPKNCRRSKNSNSTRNKSSASNASTSSGKKQSASKRSQTPLKAAPGGSGTAGSLSSSGSMDNVPLQRSGSMEELSSQNSSTVDECSSSVEDDHPQYSPFDDLSIVGGTLDALVILWTCNATKISLPHNAKWLVVLQRKVGRGLPLLCSSYRGEGELSRTILQLASFLPRSLVPTLVGHCLSRVRTIDEKAALDLPFDLERFPCMIYVSALCNWNRLDDLLDLIHDWLSAGFDSVAVEPQQEEVTRQANSSSRRSSHNNSCTGRNSKKDSKAGKSRGVRFASPALGEKTSEPKPLAAVAVLRAILHHRLNRNALVVNNRHLLLRLLPTLGRVQRCIELRFEGQADTHLCSDQLLLSCWEDWLCVTALLHHMTSSLPTQDKSARKSA
ncbi:Condensin-2 complex subunit G2 [Trinorchestia longiramus]|nr:Condensin-2 complex subunit G2 [Trinorchestia longiramus]